MLPSGYFKRQCYIALDVDEEPAVHAAPFEAIGQFLGLPLTDEQRRRILWDNCAHLCNIKTPAGSLMQPIPQVSVAE